jgi:hypothetical protein
MDKPRLAAEGRIHRYAAAFGILMALVTGHTATAQTTVILPTRPEPKPSTVPVPDGMIVPPFERLPDGRIGVEIFGQRIALPGTDDYLDRIEFYPLRQRPFGKPPTFTLRQALAEPDKATLAFEQEPEWISVRFIGWPENAPIVLGRFDRRLLPSADPGDPLAITIRRVPPNKPPTRGTLSQYWPPEAASTDEDGYFVRPGVTPPHRKEPTEVGYRHPAAQRLWPTGVDLVVICRWVGSPVRECGQSQRTQDGRISIYWAWDEDTFRTARSWFKNYFPKPRWKELDLRLHEVANHLLLNKPSGELE